MENNKLATLVLTSMFAVLSTNASNSQNECNDACIYETTVSSVTEMKTCGQCNMPKPTHKITQK